MVVRVLLPQKLDLCFLLESENFDHSSLHLPQELDSHQEHRSAGAACLCLLCPDFSFPFPFILSYSCII